MLRRLSASLAPWLAAAALIASGGCARDEAPPTPTDPATLARMAREGEAALRVIGAGRFDVLDYRAGDGGRRVEFTDDFQLRTGFYFHPFEARVRFTTDVRARTPNELHARLGAADWTVEETEAGLELYDLLGGRQRRAGEEETLRAAAVFTDLTPGFRYRRLDARR